MKLHDQCYFFLAKLLNYCLSGNKWVEGQLFSDKRGYTIDNEFHMGNTLKSLANQNHLNKHILLGLLVLL